MIVVNDGSTDGTVDIVEEYGFRVISGENRGLSHARNVGLRAATGEIVAYTDDDAYPDPDWLRYLAAAFVGSRHVGIGGPEHPAAGRRPGGRGRRQRARRTDSRPALRPGSRAHPRLQHGVPPVGAAGDRRIRPRSSEPPATTWTSAGGSASGGGRSASIPGAVVWHHRRNSVRMYWKQQKGYGCAEALLERKWPEKYNGAGHVNWAGSLYGLGLTRTILSRPARIYQGSWGSALFQSLYQPAPGVLAALPLMPEWYLAILILALLSALGFAWPPLLAALPLLGFAVGALAVQAGVSAARARFHRAERSRRTTLKLYALTALLYLLQPIARLQGRFAHGLTPWRRRGPASSVVPPRRHSWSFWRERGRTAAEHLADLSDALREAGAVVRAGGDFDRWDLEVRLGSLGASRILLAPEEHGGGRQLLRFRIYPWVPPAWLTLAALSLAAGVGAAIGGAWLVAAPLGSSPCCLGAGVVR